MTSRSGEDRDDHKLNWLKSTDNELKTAWNNTAIATSLNKLVSIGKVEDLRPSSLGTSRYLTGPNSFDELIDFIYQVRCNLFHGGKDLNDENDIVLVSNCAEILVIWLNQTIVNKSSYR
jgi:hypothetical protein